MSELPIWIPWAVYGLVCKLSYFHKPVVNVTGMPCRDFFMFVFLLQGGWENDETVEEAAAREAIEEAGVRGDIVVRCL
jgi:8-oxo-dGTP pyrophosphatase MutT (NUDIX family)